MGALLSIVLPVPQRHVDQSKCSLGPEDVDRFCSGDVLLMCSDSWASKVVNLFCASRFSHAAVVYVVTDAQGLRSHYVLESIRTDDANPLLCDVISHQPAVGVRLVPLRDYFLRFRGECIAVRRLCLRDDLADLYDDFVSYLGDVLGRIVRDLHGRAYKHRMIEFFVSRTRLFGMPQDDLSSVFCSELVVYFFKQADLLRDESVSCEWTPDDLSSTGHLELRLPSALLRRLTRPVDGKLVTLGPEEYIAAPQLSGGGVGILDKYKYYVRGVLIFTIVILACIYAILI